MARGAYEYALDLLAARAYTVRNLRRKLAQKEFEAGAVEVVIERLLNSGLLDDRRFAVEFARQKAVVRGAAVRHVAQQLALKGIDRRTALDALDSVLVEEPVDTRAAMERLGSRKLRSLVDLEATVQRRRLYGFLVRRGYDIDDVRAVVRKLVS